MIWQLMKRDPAWLRVQLFTLVGAAIFALWHFFAPAGEAGSPISMASMLIAQAAVFQLIFVLNTITAQQGDTPFQATLPVTVRQVFLARVLSMFSLLWLPVAAGLLLLAALGGTHLSDVPLSLWMIFPCAVLALQCVAIRGLNIARWLIGILAGACAAVSILLVSFGMPEWFSIVLIACAWTAAAAFVLITWVGLPKSFQTAPLEAARGTGDRADSAAGAGRKVANSRSRSPLSASLRPWITVWRTIPWIGNFQILMGFGLMSIGAPPLVPVMIAASWATVSRLGTRWLSALPVSPRVLLRAYLLPPIAALCVGYLIGANFVGAPAQIPPRGIVVQSGQDPPKWPSASRSDKLPGCQKQNVLPSIEFWLPAKSSRAPLIYAPWGEVFEPPTYREYGFNIYNPFAAGCENSERFRDWQFMRATTLIYGHPIARHSGGDSYTAVGRVAPPGLRTQVVNIAVVTGWSMLSLLVVVIGDWQRVRRLAPRIQKAVPHLVGVCVYLPIMFVVFRKLDMAQWASWTLPDSLPGTIAALIIVLALLYWPIDRIFRQLEFSDKPVTTRAFGSLNQT